MHEELLPLLWGGMGVHKDDFPAALQMLVASGTLLPFRRNLQERRWVMPTRLPTAKPPDASALWSTVQSAAGAKALCVSLLFGRLSPTGLVGRLMVALHALGEILHCWRAGCVLQALINLESTRLNSQPKLAPNPNPNPNPNPKLS